MFKITKQGRYFWNVVHNVTGHFLLFQWKMNKSILNLLVETTNFVNAIVIGLHNKNLLKSVFVINEGGNGLIPIDEKYQNQ